MGSDVVNDSDQGDAYVPLDGTNSLPPETGASN
jgi:hypothetical protein